MTTDAAWGPGAASVVYVDSYRPLFLVSEDGESYELLLSAADRRMYQDKSRRKRQAAAQGKVAPVDPDYSDAELQRAASGIL